MKKRPPGRTSQVMVRVTPEEKKQLTAGAAREHESLSNWLRKLALHRIKALRG